MKLSDCGFTVHKKCKEIVNFIDGNGTRETLHYPSSVTSSVFSETHPTITATTRVSSKTPIIDQSEAIVKGSLPSDPTDDNYFVADRPSDDTLSRFLKSLAVETLYISEKTSKQKQKLLPPLSLFKKAPKNMTRYEMGLILNIELSLFLDSCFELVVFLMSLVSEELI